jgi:hypothetical protein
VLAIAGVFTLLSAIAAAGSGPGQAKPLPSGGYDLTGTGAVPSEPVATA